VNYSQTTILTLVLVSVLASPALAQSADVATKPINISRPTLDRLDPAVRQQIESAREQLDVLLNSSEDQDKIIPALGFMADLYVAYDLLQPALDCLEALSDLLPEDPKWHYLKGYIHDRRGSIEPAIEALAVSLRLQPKHAAAALRLANLQRDQGDYERSRPLYEMALLADSTCIAASYGLGEITRRQGDYESAIAQFKEILERHPEAARPRYGLGLALRSAGQIEAAEVQLNQVNFETVSLGEWWGCADPYLSELSAKTTGSAMHILRGIQAQFSGNIEVEVDEYRKAIEANPEDPVAHKSLAAALYRQGNFEESSKHYSIAIDLHPTDAFSHYDFGQVLWKRELRQEALRHYQLAAEINPSFLLAHRRLAEIYVAAESLELALFHLRKVTELAPQDLQARAQLAMVLVHSNQREEAIAAIADLLEEFPPDDPETLLNLAALMANLGAPQEAEKFFQQVAHSSAPDTLRARAHEMIGQVRFTEGLRDQAVEEYNEAVRLDPTSQSARAGLSRLLESKPN
jgi:tetratricopeptide (TPR) repeat protein